MYPTTEQIVAANKVGTELLIAIANIQVAAFEHFSSLTFNATKTAFEERLAQKLINLNAAVAQPSIEKAIAYSRGMYGVVLQAHSEMTRVMEAHAGELNKGVVGNLDQAPVSPTSGSGVAAAAVNSALAAAGPAYDSSRMNSKQTLRGVNRTAATRGVKGHRKRNGVKSAPVCA